MEENIKRKDRDEIGPKNNLQRKWQWFKEFYFLKYTRTNECPHSVCKTRLGVFEHLTNNGFLYTHNVLMDCHQ